MSNIFKFKTKETWVLFLLFLLGISSGYPLTFTSLTLKNWLSRNGVSVSVIGLLTYASIPYSFKFLWSPIIDFFSFSKKFGARKGWILFAQIFLAFFVYVLSKLSPQASTKEIFICALLIAFFSATQDIAADALRIDLLNKMKTEQNADKNYGFATTLFIYGYRTGMYVSSVTMLTLPDSFSWSFSFEFSAFVMLGFMLVTFAIKEPQKEPIKINYKEYLSAYVSLPFSDFLKKDNAKLIILLAFSYKFCDALSGSYLSKFYQELGHSNVELATYMKTFSLPATLLGAFTGGIIVAKFGMLRSIFLCTILMPITNLVYIIHYYLGANNWALAGSTMVENFTGGISDVVLVSFLTSICSPFFAATQYALLSAITSSFRVLVTGALGFIIKENGWLVFYIITILFGLPSVVVSYILSKRIKSVANK